MHNTRYQPAKHVGLHTPTPSKQALSAEIDTLTEQYLAAGGKITTVTAADYRQHNIDREAMRDQREAMRESLHRIAFHEESSFDSPMLESAAALDGILQQTQGNLQTVDGVDEEYRTVEPTPDFFDAVDAEIDATNDEDYDDE